MIWHKFLSRNRTRDVVLFVHTIGSIIFDLNIHWEEGVEYGQYHNDIHIKKNSKLYIFLAWSKIAKFYKRPVT